MSDEPMSAHEAAIRVFNALQGLTDEERGRVLHSAAALFGISFGGTPAPAAEPAEHVQHQAAHSASQAPVKPGKPVSIVELIQEKQPATNMQRIAVFAFYREHYEGADRFARTDLAPYFAKAKLAKPGNFDRDFNGAVKAGWIHDDGANSYLTSKGEAAVRAGFDGKGKARGSAVRKKKATAKGE